MNATAWPISSWLSSLCGGGAPCGSPIGADRRTRRDFAEPLRLLADEDRPQAQRIVLVADNLNTHGPGALYEAFEPEEAHRLAARLEWHYTPEHGSWLNIAECELSVLARPWTGAFRTRTPWPAK